MKVQPVAELLGEKNEREEIDGLQAEKLQFAGLGDNVPRLHTFTKILLREFVGELGKQVGIVLLTKLLLPSARIQFVHVERQHRPPPSIDHFSVADQEEHHFLVKLVVHESKDEDQKQGQDYIRIQLIFVLDFRYNEVHVVEEFRSVVLNQLLSEFLQVHQNSLVVTGFGEPIARKLIYQVVRASLLFSLGLDAFQKQLELRVEANGSFLLLLTDRLRLENLLRRVFALLFEERSSSFWVGSSMFGFSMGVEG